MENTKILIDSTILVDFLRKQNKTNSLLWKLKEKYPSLAISSISVFELYAGATNEKKITDVVLLLKWFDIITPIVLYRLSHRCHCAARPARRSNPPKLSFAK